MGVQLGFYGRALEDANKGLEVDENWIEGYRRKGLAYYCLGQYEQVLP